MSAAATEPAGEHRRRPRTASLVSTLFAALFTLNSQAFGPADLTLPPGYTITVFAAGLSDPRQLARSPSGTVFVGSMRAGTVHALRDRDGDHVAEEITEIARNLTLPSGVAFRDGALYVAAVSRILRFDDIDAQLDRAEGLSPPQLVYDQLPEDTHHGWKFIAFGPDGRLYVPVGAPCNVCLPELPYAALLSMRADGTDVQIVARGIRNTVGFDWAPDSGHLWFTDNGRDWLGDDLPPGELNRITQAGQHFGFPHVHGGEVRDPEFGQDAELTAFVAPVKKLGAHVAPLGIEFYRGKSFPHEAGNSLFVAEHGSWNRSRKAGYRVMRAQINADGKVTAYTPFVTGWLRGEAHWGPVDFLSLADGSLLISDDHRGRIYRVDYVGP